MVPRSCGCPRGGIEGRTVEVDAMTAVSEPADSGRKRGEVGVGVVESLGHPGNLAFALLHRLDGSLHGQGGERCHGDLDSDEVLPDGMPGRGVDRIAPAEQGPSIV